MGSVRDRIDDGLAQWLVRQRVFFVATAPLAADGHVNLSPKGLDTLRVLDDHTVAYLDLTGSGVETIAHIRENGRVTLMFCAFEGPPRIVRLHGRGAVAEVGSAAFATRATAFSEFPSARAVITVDVQRVADSCGYAVPLMQFVGDRDHLHKWAEKRGPDGMVAYRAEKNSFSIDGLPAAGA